MKKSDLKPGTKVLASINDEEYGDMELIPYFYDSYGGCTLTGVVLDKTATTGKVWVKWDEGGDYERDEEEEEVEIKLLALASEQSKYEQEYKEVAKQVKEKVKQAAALVREANKLAKKGHAKDLQSMGAWDLVSAMDDSGWRSSSWGC